MATVVFPPVLPDHQSHQGEVAARLDGAVNALQARELLEPVLLLSAGYLAVPFLLGQLRLLLTPLLVLLGVSLQVGASPCGCPYGSDSGHPQGDAPTVIGLSQRGKAT